MMPWQMRWRIRVMRLLVFAASAIVLEATWDDDRQLCLVEGKEWNPVDDGDQAFRLLAELHMMVSYSQPGLPVFGDVFVSVGPRVNLSEDMALDAMASTKLAISRAAAVIGSEMF